MRARLVLCSMAALLSLGPWVSTEELRAGESATPPHVREARWIIYNPLFPNQDLSRAYELSRPFREYLSKATGVESNLLHPLLSMMMCNLIYCVLFDSCQL